MSTRAEQVIMLHDVLTAMIVHLLAEGLETDILINALHARAAELEKWNRSKPKAPKWWQWTAWIAMAIESEGVKNDKRRPA